AADARMERGDGEFLRLRIRLPDRKIGDEQGRPPGGQAEPLAVVAALAMAEAREEVDLFDHRAARLLERDEDLAAGGGDLGGSATARQAGFRMAVVADHRGVDVAEAVELGGAEKADRDPPALQPVAEHFRDGNRGDRRVAENAVADGK